MDLLEAQIEKEVCRYAAAHGWLERKLRILGRKGAPDRWFFHPSEGGRLVVIEFKRPGEGPEPLQRREMTRLRDHGVSVHVVDSVAQGKALLKIDIA